MMTVSLKTKREAEKMLRRNYRYVRPCGKIYSNGEWTYYYICHNSNDLAHKNDKKKVGLVFSRECGFYVLNRVI